MVSLMGFMEGPPLNVSVVSTTQKFSEFNSTCSHSYTHDFFKRGYLKIGKFLGGVVSVTKFPLKIEGKSQFIG